MQKIITIDGGAATGKSFISEAIAKHLNYQFIATGKLYRLLAIYFFINKIEIKEDLSSTLNNIKVNFVDGLFIIDDFAYDQKQLFDQHLLKDLSLLSSNLQIRNFCNRIFSQIVINSSQTFIVEGRDAGTVIFPKANLKFFLIVNEETAANRRLLQEQKLNPKITLKQVQDNLRLRNEDDENRKISPLHPAQDAIIIDTSNLNKEQILAKIIKMIEDYHD